jgi:hypothetical protein
MRRHAGKTAPAIGRRDADQVAGKGHCAQTDNQRREKTDCLPASLAASLETCQEEGDAGQRETERSIGGHAPRLRSGDRNVMPHENLIDAKIDACKVLGKAERTDNTNNAAGHNRAPATIHTGGQKADSGQHKTQSRVVLHRYEIRVDLDNGRYLQVPADEH